MRASAKILARNYQRLAILAWRDIMQDCSGQDPLLWSDPL